MRITSAKSKSRCSIELNYTVDYLKEIVANVASGHLIAADCLELHEEVEGTREKILSYLRQLGELPEGTDLTKPIEEIVFDSVMLLIASRNFYKLPQCGLKTGLTVEKLDDEVERLRRDYAIFEELSPPDVPRKTFVNWCYKAWEQSQEMNAELERLRAIVNLIKNYIHRMATHAETQVTASCYSPSWIGYRNAMRDTEKELQTYVEIKSANAGKE